MESLSVFSFYRKYIRCIGPRQADVDEKNGKKIVSGLAIRRKTYEIILLPLKPIGGKD